MFGLRGKGLIGSGDGDRDAGPAFAGPRAGLHQPLRFDTIVMTLFLDVRPSGRGMESFSGFAITGGAERRRPDDGAT